VEQIQQRADDSDHRVMRLASSMSTGKRDSDSVIPRTDQNCIVLQSVHAIVQQHGRLEENTLLYWQPVELVSFVEISWPQ